MNLTWQETILAVIALPFVFTFAMSVWAGLNGEDIRWWK